MSQLLLRGDELRILIVSLAEAATAVIRQLWRWVMIVIDRS